MVDRDNIVKWLRDAVPLGEHPNPWGEYIQVRLATIQAAADAIEAFDDDKEWIEKGIVEWRDLAQHNAKQAVIAEAASRVAIRHLQAVLSKSSTEQDVAAAVDWLTTLGI